MTKKHEMSEQEYLIYKKQHAYADVLDTEQGKIQREKASYVQNRRKSEQRLQQNLRSVMNAEDLDAIDEKLEIPEEEQVAVRVLRNARTHKKRIIGLRKHEEQAAAGAEPGGSDEPPEGSQ